MTEYNIDWGTNIIFIILIIILYFLPRYINWFNNQIIDVKLALHNKKHNHINADMIKKTKRGNEKNDK